MFFIENVIATFGPRAFITEYVTADYYSNGSINTTASFLPCNSNPCRYGVIEVAIPNNDDILQQVRINLSSTANTNLQSNISFKNFLTSYPTANSKQNVSVNTTQGVPADYYNITNNNTAPTIDLSVAIGNLNGGTDIFDDDNILTSNNTLNFTLNVSNSGTVPLNNSNIAIQFRKDMLDSVDVINVSNPICDVGICSRTDSDSDGYFDKISWTVNITQTNFFLLRFNGTITSGVNFLDSNTSVNLDLNDRGVVANYNNSSTFTGITIAKKFAKSSVQQSVDMVQNSTSGTWLVRGYIKNMANSSVGSGEFTLSYNISSWRLYKINETTGAPLQNVQSGTFSSAILAPNDVLYTTDSRSSNTTWHNSGNTTKPFYGSYFEWEVIWNSTNSESYLAFSNSTLDLPILYKIDMVNDKLLSGGISPNTNNSVVTVTDTARHNGNNNASARFVQILSVVPVNTTTNQFHGKFRVNMSSVKFFFDNSTLGGSSFEVNTSNVANWTVTDPAADGSSNGLVNLTITNVSNVTFASGGMIGHQLNNGEKIKLVFDVISNESMVAGDKYNFTGNSTMKTVSGTPLTELQPSQIAEVTSLIINLPINTVDFGSMNPNESNDTLDNLPFPFIVENNGSVLVNITIEATNLWQTQNNPSSFYKFQSAENETGSVPSTTDLVTVFTNMPAVNNPIKFVTRLNFTASNNSIRGELNITVPSDEPAGPKNSTVTFIATQS